MPAQPPTAPQVVLSSEATAILDAAIAGTQAEDLQLIERPFFFPSFQGGTLTMIGFRVGVDGLVFGIDPFAAAAAEGTQPAEVARLELFGVLYRDGEEFRRIGTEFHSARDRADDTYTGTHSFGDTLPAGSYELVWGVRDAVTGKAGTRRDTLEVPNLLAGGLGTSSVMLVDGNPAPAPGRQCQPNTVYDGVCVLTILLPDNIHHVFPADTQQVMLTYGVVGTQMDATTQQPSLEITYRILTGEGQSLWRVAPQPLSRPTVGQPIPLSQVQGLVPGKRYRFEIVVKDLLAGTEAKTEVPFEIAA